MERKLSPVLRKSRSLISYYGDLLNFGNFVLPKFLRMRISLLAIFSITYLLLGFRKTTEVETTKKFQ